MTRDEENDESLILYHSYPYTYYVQSPSTTTVISHANTTTTTTHIDPPHDLLLSRYSSSRGSNNSFSFTDVRKPNGAATITDHHEFDVRKSVENRLTIVDPHAHRKVEEEGDCGDGDGDDDEEDEYWPMWVSHGKRRGGCWWRYCSLRSSKYSTSNVWIFLQVFWRVLVSFGLALLVFYIATKPPPPKIALKIAGIRQFLLSEGVDATGVTTKVLNCNVSINVGVDNKSKLFMLHFRPPSMELSYGLLPFASSSHSHGPRLSVEPYDIKNFHFYVGTKNKPMYGAGRNMQDVLESGKGLPIIVRGSLKFEFLVVWKLIKPKFHHQFECVVLLGGKYEKKHQTHAYESNCTML
ncbi:hypothetical protein ACFE04_004113 [Oxalis oulophora]